MIKLWQPSPKMCASPPGIARYTRWPVHACCLPRPCHLIKVIKAFIVILSLFHFYSYVYNLKCDGRVLIWVQIMAPYHLKAAEEHHLPGNWAQRERQAHPGVFHCRHGQGETPCHEGRHGAKRPFPPPPPRDFLLSNKSGILDMQEFLRLDVPNHLPPSPLPSPSPGPLRAQRRQPPPAQAWHPPSVLVVGTSMIWHVAVSGLANHSQTMVKLTDVFKEAFIYAQPSYLFEHKSPFPFIHIHSSFNTVRAKGQINEINELS